MKRKNSAYNFNAGPSALPLSVLEKAQEELIDFRSTGMSVMELSHRSPAYETVHNEAIQQLRKLFTIPDTYEVLFLQGGASTQFAMIPMNFLQPQTMAGYIMSGSWSEKAFAETSLVGDAYEAASSKADQYRYIPAIEKKNIAASTAYLHLTSNNTIFGTQWQQYPDFDDIPLIADMSSDIMSKPINVNNFELIYAGAQKNLGPSGVTVVIIKKEWMEQANKNVPTMLNYKTHAEKNSLYNTPPTFGIYMLGEVLQWIGQKGGVHALSRQNEKKAALIYDVIDQSHDFYVGHAKRDSRSLMNITFRLQSEELEKEFLTEAGREGFVGLNGHRSIGGCRASTYNAVPVEACKALSEFMNLFMEKHS